MVGSTNSPDAYHVLEHAKLSYGTGDTVPMQSQTQAKSPGRSSSSKQGGIAGARHITRNRTSYSCHTCRRRKVKCDKAHPVCGNCSKNGTECSYDVAPKKGSAAKDDDEYINHGTKRRRETSRPLDEDVDMSQSLFAGRGTSDLRGGSHAIEARLDKLTNMIERLSKVNDSIPIQEMGRQLQNMSQVVEPQLSAKAAPSAPKKTSSSGTGSPPRGGDARGGDASGDDFPIPSGNATDPVDPIGSLNLGHLSLEDGRSRYVGTTYWAYISDEINELNQLLRDQARTHDDSLPDESSTEDAMTNPAITSPRAKISPYSTTHYQARRRSSLRRDNFHQTILFSAGESPTSYEKIVDPNLLEDIPSRRQSDILYRGFMSGVHAISPVLHPPTILKSYRAFWDWYDRRNHSGDHCPDPSFVPLLYAIWYGGSVTISLRTINAEFPNVQSRLALSEMLNDQVTIWLANISFPRNPTLHGLAAFLLVQTILSREEQPLASSLFISMTLRVAQTMGLHRDPAQFGIQSSEAEARRRVWWHIVHMDSVVAMSSGLPPLVNDENFWDVREPSEVKDTLLGTPQAEKYTKLVTNNLRPRDNPDDPTICGGNSMVNVFYLCARGKYIMARAIRRILRIQLGTKPITGSDMEELRSILIELQFQLNSLVNRIPLVHHPNAVGQDSHSVASDPASVSPGMSFAGDGSLPADGPNGCLEQYHTPVLVAFHKWARILLSLFIDKAFCVAYQPFLKNAKSRIWPTARQGALRHCHGFMEKFIALATDADFQPFQWSWPGNHQPMHAAMIMLIDLYERPNTPEALRSRAFIDKIFSISGPDGGVVGGEDGVTTARPLKDGGKEAWDLMRRLREKAWQKAGLDPQQFWTEQAQIRAGVTSGANTPNPYTASRSGFIPARGKQDAYLMEFANRFYEMTRAQRLPNPVVSSLRQELPRYSPAIPAATPKPPSQQQKLPQQHIPSNSPPSLAMPAASPPQQSLDTTLTLANLATERVGTRSPNNNQSLFYPQQQQQQQQPQALMQPPHSYSASSPPTNFPIDGLPPTSPNSVAAAPTPPSMMDPNLNFDWDQWDAVFGQLLPVADELMELDPVAGLELPDIGLGLGNYDGASDMWPDLKM
ncbi:putative transcriptional regulatory protein C139,03 [Talaromyces islandicus]|uniref:Putative transcriptional regulatory protein C139,03 n=1 Tax=Talaromyces islandicus TaxID=28573 RepID=A0A0U1MA45_TALIS|nr:putative transcriptional regulatory protein C139,03 [Talaromyces islandicus]